jgi:hypothetical protein
MENNSEIKFTFVTEDLINNLENFANHNLGFQVYNSLPGVMSRGKALELARLLDDFIIEQAKARLSQESDPDIEEELEQELTHFQTILLDGKVL